MPGRTRGREQHHEHLHTDAGLERGRDHHERPDGGGIAERGECADTDEQDDEPAREDHGAPSDESDARAGGQHDQRHQHQQGGLVVGPEEADDDVLAARRREVDDGGAHGGER